MPRLRPDPIWQTKMTTGCPSVNASTWRRTRPALSSRAKQSGIAVALTLSLLTLGVAGCSTAPGDGGEKPPAQGSGEGDWGQSEEPTDETPEVVELPAGFPSEEFVLPEDAVLQDAGERGPGNWFVVLRAADVTQADEWWAFIVEAGAFTVQDEIVAVDGGREATLVGGTLTVGALTITEDDGSILMNYDLGPTLD